MESYLRQYQSYMSNITDQSSAIFTPNPQILSDQQSVYSIQLSPEQLREKLRKQLEYYFSRENMINDIYLQSQMDVDNYVLISIIANFKLVKRLTHDLQLIIDVLKESPLVEVDLEEKKVRSSDNKTYLPTRKRCIIILRNVPLDATENEILEIFRNESCSVSAMGCERVLESDHSDWWYVTFNNEDDAQNAFLYLTRENISIRGQKILGRMKACLWQKPLMPSNDGLVKPPAPQASSLQEQYTPVYIQSLPTNPHPHFRNISQQPTAMTYRPTQILQQQAHLPMNYNINLLSSHQQNMPSTLSYAPNAPPINMNFYPQTQYLSRNHPIFPTNFWYIPSSLDSYSPMTYNGFHKSKTRIITAKPRYSNKSMSNHEKNNHSLNSDHNHASHPENNDASSVNHNKTSLNRSIDSNISSSSMQTCSSTTDDYQNLNHENPSTQPIAELDNLTITNE